MLDFLTAASSSDPTEAQDLAEWRERVLEWVLRGILAFWALALIGGIYNVIKTYRREVLTAENALGEAILIVSLYMVLTALFVFITFHRGLRYELRAVTLLFLLYSVGAMGLALSALSGDGRIFLFALVVLTAILFDLRASLAAFLVSLLTMLVIGYLEVHGKLTVPIERQINSGDGGAWFSGTAVFIVLSVAALISINYLLRAYERSLHAARESLSREQRITRTLRTLSNVNQIIVREQDEKRLLKRVCDELLSSHGYSFVWIGLIEPNGATLKLAASAGKSLDPDLFTTHLDQNEGLACAILTLQKRSPVEVMAQGEGELCLNCPRRAEHPNRAAAAFPLVREDHRLGVLVVDHAEPQDTFDPEEIQLLSELAEDVGYALEKMRADKRLQQNARHQTLLTSLIRVSLETSAPSHMLTSMMEHLREAYAADGCYMVMCDPHGKGPQPAAAAGDHAEVFMQIEQGETALGQLTREMSQLLVVEDAPKDPRIRPEVQSQLAIGALLAAPLAADKIPLGGIFLVFHEPRSFSSEEMTVLNQVANQVALAVSKSRLDAQIQARAIELEKLYASAQDMVASLLDPSALLEKLARHVAEALDTTSTFVMSVDSTREVFIELAEHWTNQARPAEQKPEVGAHFAMQNYTSVMNAILAGETLTLHRDDEGLSETERNQFFEYDVQSMLFVPLMARGRLLGDLEIWESRRRREFSEAEVQLAQAIAAHAAAIIENASLYKQMEESEAYFRALSENSAEGVAIVDTKGKLTYVARTEERILGYNPAEVIGRYAFEIVHPDDLSAVQAAFRECLREADRLVRMEYRARHVDGLWRQLEVTIKNLLGEPAVRGVVANFRDITERKQAVEALSQREAYFRALIENSAEGIVILDEQGMMRYVAPAEERLTGYNPEQAVGQSVFSNIHPEDLPNVVAAVQEGIAHPGITRVVEYRFKRMDGEWRYFEATGHSLLNDPHISGLVINYRDITERKLAEQAIAKHAEDLAQAYDSTLAGWARALELRDELTEGHTRRVTDLTLELARALDITEDELAHIRRGALLHDIGKMGIPDSILHKPGPLTAHESRIMQMHPQYAYELLSLIPFLQPAIDIPYCHHERWDGTGYPRGLRGKEIPLAARIFSVVDVWDALTTDRPYRAAWSRVRAREYILAESGCYFDPEIVQKFLKLLDSHS
ncbi:MAG: PAS domain S-box protein [Chloroflexi bacterium]|nr:PAS domain S-box protein [Chloroflexota bacterium]